MMEQNLILTISTIAGAGIAAAWVIAKLIEALININVLCHHPHSPRQYGGMVYNIEPDKLENSSHPTIFPFE